MSESIGTAKLLANGAIELDLHTNDGGRHGQARVVYPKEHPQYAEVLQHLGGLQPGETKPVPPWS